MTRREKRSHTPRSDRRPTPHSAILRERDSERDLEGRTGRPCHLCHVLTPWELPRVGPTCDRCSPLVLGVWGTPDVAGGLDLDLGLYLSLRGLWRGLTQGRRGLPRTSRGGRGRC